MHHFLTMVAHEVTVTMKSREFVVDLVIASNRRVIMK